MSKRNKTKFKAHGKSINTATDKMKTLAEQVNEIKSAEMGLASKKVALMKLGLTSYECNLILGEDVVVARGTNGYTFGVEIECLVPRDTIIAAAHRNGVKVAYETYNHHDNKTYFKFVSDASICGANPIECVSPILSSRGGFNKLKAVCKSLNEAGAQVNRSTGLHVHIGAQDMTDKQYINIFINYQRLEGLIDSFMANSRRANNNIYSKSMRGYDFTGCRTKNEVYYQIGTRYTKVNAAAINRHGTVEFRQHQGSTDYEKISMWVRFCAKLVAWSKDNRLANDITNIDDVAFLSKSEKDFFRGRIAALN